MGVQLRLRRLASAQKAFDGFVALCFSCTSGIQCFHSREFFGCDLWQMSNEPNQLPRFLFPPLPAGEQILHLINLSLLTRDDALAQIEDCGVLYGRLFAHEDGTRVMRNHRS